MNGTTLEHVGSQRWLPEKNSAGGKIMITKRPKVVILFVGFMLLGALGISALAMGSGNGNGNDTVDMDLRFAGTFISRIQYVVPSTGEPATSPLIRLNAKGSPGPCEISFFGGQDQTVGFPPGEDCCGGPACLLISIIENPQVFTFKDLSMLFATGSGEVCIDLPTGIATGTVDLTFTGGTGRFEGATGAAVTVFEIVPVSIDGSFNSETGQTVGTILLP